jgi:hypothetical protein
MDTIETYDKDASALSRLTRGTRLEHCVAHPITGGGFDVSWDYQPLWPRYAPNPNRVQAAHSIYFQVLETQGFVGLFLFLTIFFLAYRANGWVVKRTKHRPDLQWLRDLGSMMQVGGGVRCCRRVPEPRLFRPPVAFRGDFRDHA